MNNNIENKLISIAKEKLPKNDPSHDINHALRVLKNAKMLSKEYDADLDIIIPSALFHDIINPPKNSLKAIKAAELSAIATEKILLSITDFPKEKIILVKKAINECSFSKNIKASFLESEILQDADRLEATGVISIMRTFSSTGQMNLLLYNPKDPFCKNRKPEAFNNGLDLFYERLLIVKDRLNTDKAKKIAKRRTKILETFLEELRKELDGE